MKKLLLAVFILACQSQAATYYVDWTNGLDTNNGTAKGTPWKRAPGMTGCSNNCNSTTVLPGDSVILKGCVTWPNAALPWFWNTNGSAGNPIYFGVDLTWWDNTVTGCASAWNRPVLNGQGLTTNRASGREDIVLLWGQYTTFDNIEITGALANPTSNATEIIDLLGGAGSTGSQGVIISNVYIHGWVNPYFCYGTGNVAANSSTITNFVPISCSAGFGSSWGSIGPSVQVYPQGSYWPVQSNAPVVTAVTGTNPYTISTNSTTVSGACSSCNIVIGEDNENIISGNEGGNAGAMVINSVIDGSDTAEVALNPYIDCGLSEGNNNLCVMSGIAGWRGPQIWLNNVIRYVASAYIGSDGYFGGNLFEHVGVASTNPTGHTNIVEAIDAASGLHWLFWNNVVRHTTNPNPNTPGGRITVGLPIEPAADTGLASYTFNNVMTDTITNYPFEPLSGVSNGVAYFFSNTLDCGPSWSLTYNCVGTLTQGGFAQNNLFITTGTGSQFTNTTNVTWTPTTATAAGYTTSQNYVYSPPNSNCTGQSPCTVGTGTSLSTLCTAITAIYAAAGTACLSDTIYGATYDSVNHRAVTGVRNSIVRPGTPNIGAYQYQAVTTSGAVISGLIVGSAIIH